MARVKISWIRSSFTRLSGYVVQRGETLDPFNHEYRTVFFIKQPLNDITPPASLGVVSIIDDKTEAIPGGVWNPEGLADLDSPTHVDGQTLFYTVIPMDICGYVGNEYLEGSIVFITGAVPGSSVKPTVRGAGIVYGNGPGMCCRDCGPQPLCCYTPDRVIG